MTDRLGRNPFEHRKIPKSARTGTGPSKAGPKARQPEAAQPESEGIEHWATFGTEADFPSGKVGLTYKLVFFANQLLRRSH